MGLKDATPDAGVEATARVAIRAAPVSIGSPRDQNFEDSPDDYALAMPTQVRSQILPEQASQYRA